MNPFAWDYCGCMPAAYVRPKRSWATSSDWWPNDGLIVALPQLNQITWQKLFYMTLFQRLADL